MTEASRRKGPPVGLDAGNWVLYSGERGDEVATVAAWLSDPLVARVLGRPCGPPDLAQAAAYVQGFDRVRSHLFMVRRKEDGSPEAMAIVRIDGRHLVADVDVVVGTRTTRARDGQAVLLQAARAAARWIFIDVGLAKIMVRVLERNRRTADWAARHMTLEGTLRGHARLPDGTRHTVLQYGLLRDEWLARRAAAS
jgi:RimJ/RimL family protein N-acetyltransferase